ncbi:MAG: hypothetical protein QXS20_02790 [Candidatus Thorarchaeota archaeon]
MNREKRDKVRIDPRDWPELDRQNVMVARMSADREDYHVHIELDELTVDDSLRNEQGLSSRGLSKCE